MEIKCPFWAVCGAAPMRQCWAQLSFPYGDPQRDYIAMFCSGENKYLECEHYKIRSKSKEAEKKMEALAPEKKREIIVQTPFAFDSLTKILRKGGLIVKNIWLNMEPSQEEIDLVVTAIEEAADILKQKYY